MSSHPLLRWTAIIVLGGIGAGVSAGLMTLALHTFEYLAFGVNTGTISGDVTSAPSWRRFLAPIGGALIAGGIWWWLRASGPVTSVETAVFSRKPMGVKRSFIDAFTQILVVATGGPVGREAAPRQGAAATADYISRKFHLPDEDRRLAVAAAAGAGLAAVYNVPIAGVIFVVEILLGGRARPKAYVLASMMAIIGMLVARPIVGNHPVYDFPIISFTPTLFLWGLLAIPVGALVGVGFRTFVSFCKKYRPTPGWHLPLAIGTISTLAAALALAFPQIVGNGMDIAQAAIDSSSTLPYFIGLAVVKVLATSLLLGAGADGGVLTPSLAVGAALGAALALAVGADTPAVALIFAGAVLGIVQGGWIFGGVMVWELAGAPMWFIPITVAAAGGTWIVASQIHKIRPNRKN